MSNLARPVTRPLGPGHCCPRCLEPEPVEPLAQLSNSAKVCYVYECPRCRHAWWNTYLMAALTGWPQGAAA